MHHLLRHWDSRHHRCNQMSPNNHNQPVDEKGIDTFFGGTASSLFPLNEIFNPYIYVKELVHQKLGEDRHAVDNNFEDQNPT